jgi:lycopene beta-cyclase
VKDLIVVGAGLANGLLLDRVLAAHPQLEVQVLEAGPTAGGNHTWCFHHSDVESKSLAWLEPYVSASWDGYDVKFPSHARTLPGRYCAIRSSDFARRVQRMLGERLWTDTRVAEVRPHAVTLADGRVLEAKAVIDGRGGQGATGTVRCAFQKFLGQDLRLSAPHGLTRPMLMDASVEQLDGFRFIYVLPWDAQRVLVEDTRYSDHPALDAERLRADLAAWVQRRGWSISHVEREEMAALPLPLSGQWGVSAVPTTGTRGGLFHATTGYSLPMAVRVAERLANSGDFSPEGLSRQLATEAASNWAQMGFFRMLNRMLFAVEPSVRVKIFDSFYRHEPDVIGRFYAGTLTLADKLKALRRGASAVPVWPAMKAALNHSSPSR